MVLAPSRPLSRLASNPVTIPVEAEVIFANHGDFAGVVGPIATSSFAVVVRRVGIETGTLVIGVAVLLRGDGISLDQSVNDEPRS